VHYVLLTNWAHALFFLSYLFIVTLVFSQVVSVSGGGQDK
jgi:hypothetical protein